jgi:hypothetical protein
MKHFFRAVFAGFAILVAVSYTAPAQESLGDLARQARMQKPAPSPGEKVYTNDNIPTNGGLGTASVSSPAAAPATDATKTDTTKKPDAKAAAGSPADQQKAYEDWKTKIDAQKNAIDLLQREISVLQRENQMKQAVYYSDPGSRLRDPQLFTQETQKNLDDTAAKQKDLADAQQKLSDLQDQARKEGVPNSYID